MSSRSPPPASSSESSSIPGIPIPPIPPMPPPRPPIFLIVSSRSPPPASSSESSSSFHLVKSTLSQCCLVLSSSSLSQYGPSSTFSRANSIHLGLTWYLVCSGSISFSSFMLTSYTFLSAEPVPLKYRESFSTLISGSTTSETLMVTKTIFGLCAQDTLGVRGCPADMMSLVEVNQAL